jgi:hypothetical protein
VFHDASAIDGGVGAWNLAWRFQAETAWFGALSTLDREDAGVKAHLHSAELAAYAELQSRHVFPLADPRRVYRVAKGLCQCAPMYAKAAIDAFAGASVEQFADLVSVIGKSLSPGQATAEPALCKAITELVRVDTTFIGALRQWTDDRCCSAKWRGATC